LSINEHPDIREVFREFKVQLVSSKYTVSKGKQIKGRELVVTNY
jgi:hypothetical protein